MGKEKGKGLPPDRKPVEEEVAKKAEYIEPVDEWPKPEPSPPAKEETPKDKK